ncbi:hypothetical protein GJ496_009190 [Pomphorhynchus laevis]|nr:hypothetical protein GJ496_009190 [Pomphorhynchus laevis]
MVVSNGDAVCEPIFPCYHDLSKSGNNNAIEVKFSNSELKSSKQISSQYGTYSSDREILNSDINDEAAKIKYRISSKSKESHNFRKEILAVKNVTSSVQEQIHRANEQKNYQDRLNQIWKIKTYHLEADQANVRKRKNELNSQYLKRQKEFEQLQKELEEITAFVDKSNKEIDTLDRNEKNLAKCDLIIGNMRSEYSAENRLLAYKLNLTRQAVQKLKGQSEERRRLRIQNRNDLSEINQMQCKLNWKCEGLLAHNLDRKQHHDTLFKHVHFIEKELARTKPKYHILSNKVDLLKSKALRNDIKVKLQLNRIEQLANEKMQRIRTENMCRSQIPIWSKIIKDLQQKLDEVKNNIYLNLGDEHKEKSMAQSRLKESRILELSLGRLQKEMLSQHKIAIQNNNQIRRLRVISSILQSRIEGVEKQLENAMEQMKQDIMCWKM